MDQTFKWIFTESTEIHTHTFTKQKMRPNKTKIGLKVATCLPSASAYIYENNNAEKQQHHGIGHIN